MRKLSSILLLTDKLIRAITEELIGTTTEKPTKAIAKEPTEVTKLLIKDLAEVDVK